MQEVKKIIFTFFLLALCLPSYALDEKTSFDLFSIADSVMSQEQVQDGENADVLIDNFQQVVNKTRQGNPIAAREDLKKISLTLKNNYQRLNFAKFLYANGYFLLADEVLNSITNKDGFKRPTDMIKLAYGVQYSLSEEDENVLHKSMSLIYQENMPQEASFELNKRSKLIQKSDYANYVMSCAFYQLKQFDKSLQYIKRAIEINQKNLLYRLYEAKIYNAMGEHKKVLDIIKKEKFGNEILRDEYLKLYYETRGKLSKNNADKSFYEGLICYLNNDFYGALEVVRAGLILNDKDLRLNHLLFKALINTRDFIVAEKIADKMSAYDVKNPYTQDVLGDVNFINTNYAIAAKNYEKALKLKTKDVYLKLILVNTILNNVEKNEKLTKKSSKLSSFNLDENYQLAIGILNNASVKNIASDDKDAYKNARNNLKLNYLRTALDKNPCNSFYLLEMVDSIYGAEAHNLNLLELATYLGDFNFYYYWKLGEFEDVIGNNDKALRYYKNSLNLNPKFEPVVKVISNLNL